MRSTEQLYYPDTADAYAVEMFDLVEIKVEADYGPTAAEGQVRKIFPRLRQVQVAYEDGFPARGQRARRSVRVPIASCIFLGRDG
jgi:hypothetical protein